MYVIYMYVSYVPNKDKSGRSYSYPKLCTWYIVTRGMKAAYFKYFKL